MKTSNEFVKWTELNCFSTTYESFLCDDSADKPLCREACTDQGQQLVMLTHTLWKTQTCSSSVVQSLFSVASCISDLACLSSHRNMGQQGSVVCGGRRKKDQRALLNQETSVKYHECLRASKRRCVKVTIQPRHSSKHAVITPLSQKFSLLYTWEEEKKQSKAAKCSSSLLFSYLIWCGRLLSPHKDTADITGGLSGYTSLY